MSATHAICCIHQKIIKNMDCNLYTCCVFLDLTKAFNTVNHGILLHKMEYNFEFVDYHCNYPKATYQLDANSQKLITINLY